MADRALDIVESQVAVRYPDDANFEWHLRVLVVRLDGARWVVFSADLDVFVLDLSNKQVVPLVRGALVPQRLRGNFYGSAGITDDELSTVRRECHSLASVFAPVGGAPPTTSTAEWRFSDPAFPRYGEIVDAAVTGNPNRIVHRDAVALVQAEDDGELIWTVAERLSEENVADWKEEKTTGPGRDTRVLAVSRDSRGHRFRSLRECMTDMTWLDTKNAATDWPFEGPSAVKELLHAVRASGEELVGFHEYYIRASGLNAESQIAYKHRDMLGIMHHMTAFDQMNLGELASAEVMARLIMQIHAAVKRNPRAPDFKGTSLMITSKLDSAGGVLTGEFAKYVAEEQKTHAFTLKQQRLWAEEEDKRANRKGQNNDPAKKKDG